MLTWWDLYRLDENENSIGTFLEAGYLFSFEAIAKIPGDIRVSSKMERSKSGESPYFASSSRSGAVPVFLPPIFVLLHDDSYTRRDLSVKSETDREKRHPMLMHGNCLCRLSRGSNNGHKNFVLFFYSAIQYIGHPWPTGPFVFTFYRQRSFCNACSSIKERNDILISAWVFQQWRAVKKARKRAVLQGTFARKKAACGRGMWLDRVVRDTSW